MGNTDHFITLCFHKSVVFQFHNNTFVSLIAEDSRPSFVRTKKITVKQVSCQFDPNILMFSVDHTINIYLLRTNKPFDVKIQT